MSRLPRGLLALAALPIALAGCGATAQNPNDGSASANTTGAATAHGSLTASRPSEAARMICSDETERNVALTLGLGGPPPAASQWKPPVYSCTYHLREGMLRLSVTESGTDQAAQRFFHGLQTQAADGQPIQGLANLGLPAFETKSGLVAFVKDDKTLQVDASSLPSSIGSLHRTPAELAYTLATDILGCWNGD